MKQVLSIYDSSSTEINIEIRGYKFQIGGYEKTWGERLRRDTSIFGNSKHWINHYPLLRQIREKISKYLPTSFHNI